MSHAADQRRAFVALMLGAAAIGLAPILVRQAFSAGIGPAAAGFWRTGLALPALYLITRRAEGPIRLDRPPNAMALLAGLLFAADLVCWHYSIRYTSVANATVLPNMTPILVTAFAWVVLKERPAPVFLLGMAAAVAGAVAMALSKSSTPGANPHLGDALAALTAIWYAAYVIAVRYARAAMSAAALMLWSSLVSAPAMLLAAMATSETILPSQAQAWWALAGLGATHVVGQGLIAWGLGRLPAPIAAVVMLVQPVVAALLGWLVYGEGLVLQQALGGLLVLAGVVLAQNAARRPVATTTAGPK
jgi:drug/metabolite transporter (DMT)-like permease